MYGKIDRLLHTLMILKELLIYSFLNNDKRMEHLCFTDI